MREKDILRAWRVDFSNFLDLTSLVFFLRRLVVVVAREEAAWYKINCFQSKDMEPNAEINTTVAPETTQPLRRELRSWGRDLAIALSLAVVIIIFFYQPVKVEGTSMTPLISDQERIFINKFVYRFGPDRAA